MIYPEYIRLHRDRLLKVEGEVISVTCPTCELDIPWFNQTASALLAPCARCGRPIFTVDELYPPTTRTEWPEHDAM